MNFLQSGFIFKEEDDFLRFRFIVINSIALIIMIFSLIFAIFSDLGINKLGVIHTNVNYGYAFFALLTILYLRLSKKNHTVAVHILLIASFVTFSSALIFVLQDEFRIIWFYLLVYAAYILGGSSSGIIYTIASVCMIFLINYFFVLNISELAINSAVLGLVIGSLLALVHTNKIDEYHTILHDKYKILKKIAATDGLTGIMNKHAFSETLHEHFEKSKEKKELFSLLLLDLDDFKAINDKHGHSIGDEVLVSFTYIVKLILRKDDIFARIGGDEFAIILKETPLKDAIRVAQKICQELAKKEIYVTNDSIYITTSIGLSQNSASDTNEKELFDRADRALYKAKDEGRNRVCIL